ncbi:MAG: energy transducer TonB [Vicinamibacterales bacterium]
MVAAAGSTGDTGGIVDGPVSGGDLTGLVPGVTLEPPPSPSQSPAPVRLHAGIEPPRRVNDVAPSYPAIARSAGVRGIVIIEATIDTNGAVVAARILRSVPLLDEAALQAVRQWRYVPARLNGTPTAVLITVTVNFELAGR